MFKVKSSDWKHPQFNVFWIVFIMFFLSIKACFLCFYLQMNAFNICG